MNDWPLLSLTTFLPLLGALFILTIRGEAEQKFLSMPVNIPRYWVPKATADLLRDPPPGAPKFELMERGPMKIKGKGEMVRGHFPKENGAMLRFPCPSF